jgi:hypothetical protein
MTAIERTGGGVNQFKTAMATKPIARIAASAFHTRGGNPVESRIIAQDRGEMLLVIEQTTAHAAYPGRFDLGAVDPRVFQAFRDGFRVQIPQGALPELAELGHADSDDGYVSHISPLSTFR